MTRARASRTHIREPRSPDWPVLSARLSADRLNGTSRYGDDVWYLGPAERLAHSPNLSLQFHRVPAPFRTVVKELFAQLLDDDLTPAGTTYSISSVRVHFTGIVLFLEFLQSKKLRRISNATPNHFAEYIGYLDRLDRLHGHSVRSPRLFWTYRTRLSDPMTSDPAAVPFWAAVKDHKRDSGENFTERIPEAVLTPLIWWASRYVDDLVSDIMEARTVYRATTHRTNGRPEARSFTRGASKSAACSVLERYRRSGKPLPSHTNGPFAGKVNMVALDREAKVRRGTTGRLFKDQVQELVHSNGLAGGTFINFEPRARIAGFVWTDRIAHTDVAPLLKNLQTAAYILISFFSGMRDSEVKNIRRGCITVDADATGKLSMHLLTAPTFKGNTSPTGRTATWVVAPIVQRAVAVLESLTDPEDEYLFVPLREGTTHNKPDTRQLVSGAESRFAFGTFVAWVNEHVARGGHGPAIPDVDGEPWALTTMQFRRTLAWFIARRPGGMAAGALQYKHMSLQMFRGYAGESKSGFAAEVEAERSLARGEWLGDFATDVSNTIGRARDEVIRRLDEMGRALGFAGRLPESPAQLARFLKAHDPYVLSALFEKWASCARRKVSHVLLVVSLPARRGRWVVRSLRGV